MQIKKNILSYLIKQLKSEASQMKAIAEATIAGATHPEAKPENSKDTRALEQTYLARGQSKRVEELERDIKFLEFFPTRTLDSESDIDIGALIYYQENFDKNEVEVEIKDEVEEGKLEVKGLFILPVAGGQKVQFNENFKKSKVQIIQVVSMKSPIGKAIEGKFEGEDFEMVLGGKKRFFEILKVK